MSEIITTRSKGGVLEVTLDRPKANVINLQTSREMGEVFAAFRDDPELRVAIIKTAGDRFFCAGWDLKAAAEGESYDADYGPGGFAGLTELHNLNKPVIAAVNGVAAGAGFAMACMTDLAIAAESAKFTMAYTRAGLTPDGSSTYFLTRLIGVRRAMELTLTNRVLSAAEAQSWGLINQVVADDALAGAAEDLARQRAAGPTRAFGGAKQLLYGGTTESLESQMELEARRIADAARSPDGREGIAAFLAKRPAKFIGG